MEVQIRQVIDELFPVYDTNHSNSLDAKQLCTFLVEALKRLGIKTSVSDVQAQQALRYIDKNSDGQINKIEVFNALKSIVEYKRGRNNPAPSNPGGYAPSQPNYAQNNGWGPSPPAPNNSWQNPQQQSGNSWGPSPQNNWGQPNQGWNPSPPPSHNSWGPSPSNNSWGQPSQPQNSWGPGSNFGQNQPMPNNSWGVQPQGQNTWLEQPNPYGNQNDWKGTQFATQEDHELKRLIDKIYVKYDRDHSGGLDRNELTVAFNHLLTQMGVGMRITHNQAQRLLQEVDTSNDGRVQKPQFYQMLKFLLSGADDY